MQYLIVIERTNDGFCAYSPDVLGCGAMGDTIEETIQDMQEVLEIMFEEMLSKGLPIPEPKGLRYHLDAGEFDFAPNDLFTYLTVEALQPA
jgi:predicted RNase H-like HicB family nuclease